MKSIKMFGKSVPLLAIVVISILAIGAGATLLSTYGIVSLTGSVLQSVTMDRTTDDLVNVQGGETFCVEHTITNHADVDVKAKLFVTTHDGITVEFKNILTLENKDASWNIISGDQIFATVKYNVLGTPFAFVLDAYGLPDGDYSLIYYADRGLRFVNWGGDNPGKWLGTFTSTGGILHGAHSLAVFDLPQIQDWNDNPVPADEYSDPQGDDYDHASGAKLWLVPAADYDTVNLKMTTWTNRDSILFETDLIRYFANDANEIVIPNNEVLIFNFCYTFPAYYEGTTSLNIDLQPVPLPPT